VDFFFPFVFFVFGLTFGSFLNVCIYRLPRGRSVVSPGSACPQCKTAIKPYDNIPVLSWLILRGKCRACGARITPRYMLVELATGLLFMACYFAFGWTLEAVKFCVLAFLLVGLIFTDYEMRLLPDALTLPGLLIGLAFSLIVPLRDFLTTLIPLVWHYDPPWRVLSLSDALLGALIGAGFLYAVRLGFYLLRGYEGMGLGDVKLMGMVGAFVGAKITLLSILGGSVLGTFIGIGIAPFLYRKKKKYWLARRRSDGVASERAKRAAFRNRLPFGVFLGGAALLLMFFGHQILDWYWYNLAGAPR
jgi:leader peptidase (prepilin peptidase) / N-methyltransferase